jgi:hypothetical protein
MRANMRCTLVAWLSPGATSSGQLKGKRPVSSTYSVTPHDLQHGADTASARWRSCDCVGRTSARQVDLPTHCWRTKHLTCHSATTAFDTGRVAQSDGQGCGPHQVSARVPSYLPLNSSSGAMYCRPDVPQHVSRQQCAHDVSSAANGACELQGH